MQIESGTAGDAEMTGTRYTGPALAARLAHALAGTPAERTFLSSRDGRLTWGALTDRLDAALEMFGRLGLKPGDRVVLGLGDEIADCCLFLACLRAGITAIMADRNATPDAMLALIAAARPRAVWLRSDLAALSTLQPIAAPMPLDRPAGARPAWPSPPPDETIAAVVFTSGTTSLPKGVQISHRALAAQMDAFAEVYGFGPDTRMLNLLPLHHVDGLFRGLVASAVHGAELHRPASFNIQGLPAMHDTMKREKISHLIAVPTMLSLMLRVSGTGGRPNPDLRCVISSADLLDEALWRRTEAALGLPVINAWGQSECVCDALYAIPRVDGAQIGTIGHPIGCEARVSDATGASIQDGMVGELQIRGLQLMSGYLDQPEATEAAMVDGWLRTGDLVTRDAEGTFRFVGRRSTLIVSRGVSVHPENITAALLTSDEVEEAFVLGQPDPAWGERIVACVVPSVGKNPGISALNDLCRATLTPEKRPHKILLLDALPRGAAGKVRIDILRALIAEHEASPQRAEPETPSVLSVASTCFKMDPDKLSPDSTPFNTQDWDSLGHILFIEALEAAFDITLTPEDIIGLASLADAEAITARHIARRSA